MLVEAGNGLPTGMDGRGLCPAHTSISLIMVSKKSPCEIFFPPHEDKRMLLLTMARSNRWKKKLFCPLPRLTAGRVAIGHPISIVIMPHVMVIIHHNCRLYRVTVFIAIIALCGWIMNVCQEAHVSLVKSPLVFTQMSPHFSLSVLGLWSLGMPFLCGLTVPQEEIFFWAKSSNRSGVEKKLSMYSLWPNPSTTLLRLVTVAWVAVRCCAYLYQGKYSCHMYIQ